MRLDRLRLTGFKNLTDFEIDFDQGELSTVLIGENGTGKSNVIEALVTIFRDLDHWRSHPVSVFDCLPLPRSKDRDRQPHRRQRHYDQS